MTGGMQPMQYFISWTHSDPVYHMTIPGIGVLISPPNVNHTWSVKAWDSMPDALILDSGAFQYRRGLRIVTPEEALQRQLTLLGDFKGPARLCHLDIPLLGTRDPAELDRRIRQSLQNAQWMIKRFETLDLSEKVMPIGVIQGHTPAHVYLSATILAEMGYQTFALGSLASMVASSRASVLSRVEAALEAVGPRIHILGVSAVDVLEQLAALGIESADSGAPIHEAYRGGIFYSNPWRRFKLNNAHFAEWRRNYNFAELLSEPLPCACPICIEDSSRLLEPTGKRFVNMRALHNCYHLAREIELRSGSKR